MKQEDGTDVHYLYLETEGDLFDFLEREAGIGLNHATFPDWTNKSIQETFKKGKGFFRIVIDEATPDNLDESGWEMTEIERIDMRIAGKMGSTNPVTPLTSAVVDKLADNLEAQVESAHRAFDVLADAKADIRVRSARKDKLEKVRARLNLLHHWVTDYVDNLMS